MKNIPTDTGVLKPKPGAHRLRNKIKAMKSEKAKSRKEGKRASLIERIKALKDGRPKSRKLRRLARILAKQTSGIGPEDFPAGGEGSEPKR